MANCVFNVMAYFKIQEFMTYEFDASLKNSENFGKLLEFISGSSSDIKMNTESQDEQDDMVTIFNNLPTSTNQSFKEYVVNKQYLKPEVEKPAPVVTPRIPGLSQSVQNIERSTTEMVKSKLNLDSKFKNKLTLGENYFGGDTSSYQLFEEMFRKKVFQKILINFHDGSHIRNNSQLQSSLIGFYNELNSSLKKFLDQEGISYTDESFLDAAKDYFKEKFKTITPGGMTVTIDSDNNSGKIPSFIAYSNFVILQNGFDNLLGSYNLGLVQINRNYMNTFDNGIQKYTLSNSAKFKFAFGNDNFSLLDETSTLISTLVSTTNVVKYSKDKGVYLDESSFLEIRSLNATMAKLKQYIVGDTVNSQLGVRLNPFVNLSNTIERILSNENISNGFTEAELDNLRTIYNFYFKQEGNSLTSHTLKGIHSLADVYVRNLKDFGVESNENDLYINITRYFDESVNKLYTASKYNEDTETFEKTTLTEHTIDRHYKQIEENLNNMVNGVYKYIDTNFGNSINLENSYTNVDENGDPTSKTISPMSFKLGELQFEIGKQIKYSFSYNDLIDIINEKPVSEENLKIYEALKEADKILGWNMMEDNSRMLSLILKSSTAESVNSILSITGIVLALSKIKNNAFKKLLENTSLDLGVLTLNEIRKYPILSEHINTYTKNLIVSPPDLELGQRFRKLIGFVSSARSILQGEHVKSVVTSLGGKNFPTIGLLAPIHDDKTNFGEISNFIEDVYKNAKAEEAMMLSPEDVFSMSENLDQWYDRFKAEFKKEPKDDNEIIDWMHTLDEFQSYERTMEEIMSTTPIAHNLFGQFDSDSGLVNFSNLAGEELRTEVMKDDNIKEVSKMTTPELFTMAVFNDFYGSLLGDKTKGIVSLQPLTFADKIGQMLKKFNIGKMFKYNGVDYDMTKMTPMQLRLMHYKTIGSQYMSLQKRIIGDYNKIFSHNFDTVEKFKSYMGMKWKKANADWMFNADAFVDGKITPYYASNEALSQLDSLEKFLNTVEYVYNNPDAKYTDYGKIIPLLTEDDLVELGVKAGVEVAHEVHYSGRKKRTSINNLLEIEFKNYENEDSHNKKMKVENKKMLRNMLKTGVVIDIYKEDERTIKPQFLQIEEFIKNGVDPNFKLSNWINSAGELIFFKVTKEGSLQEGEIEDLIEVDKNNNATKDNIRNNNFDVVTNPILEYFYWSSNILNTNYNLATAGGIHAHELKGLPRKDNPNMGEKYNNQLFEEAVISARTTASDKRNVFAQATIHPFLQNLLNGVPQNVKNAIVNDPSYDLFNALAEKEGMKVYDGAAFMPAIAMIMGDNSLGDLATKSFTHKLIHHRYNGDYLSAEMEKYAVFGLTNELARKSPFVYNLIKKAIGLQVEDSNGNPINGFDILSDDFTIKDPTDISEDPERIYDIDEEGFAMFNILSNSPLYKKPNENSIRKVLGFKKVSIDSTTGSILYQVKEEVSTYDRNNNVSSTIEFKTTTLNNNFDLWNLFGGQYSISHDSQGKFDFGGNNFSYSEASNYNLVDVMSNYKRIKDIKGPINSAANYDQPLKTAMLHQINMTSGIKNGARNINPTSRLSDDKPINYYITNTLHWGIQGNFDHGFDEEHVAQVSEMSQVISAAEANGNFHHIAKQLYKNIAQVVKLTMGKYNKALEGLPEEAYEILTKDMMKALLSKDEIGFAQVYLSRVQESLNVLKEKNPNYDVNTLKNTILTAFSDNNMYRAMISMIAGSVNRTSIKRKYSGIASVIKPGHDMYMVHDVDGKIVDGEEYAGQIRKIPLSDLSNVRTYDLAEFQSSDVYDGVPIHTKVDINFDNVETFYDYSNNPSKFLGSLKFSNNATVSVINGSSVIKEDFGNGVIMTKVAQGVVNFDFNTDSNEGKVFKGFTVEGKARNLRTQRIKINYNGKILDRYDLDSVKAKFAFDKISGIIKDFKESRAKYLNSLNDINISQYKKDKLANEFKKNEEKFKSFLQSSNFKSLESIIPDISNVINNSISNSEGQTFDKFYKKSKGLTLIKAVEADHLDLGKGIMKIPVALGGDGSKVEVSVEKQNPECLLSNINRHKYGIKKGTKISKINEDFFYDNLKKAQTINHNTIGDFVVKSLNNDSEMSFLNKNALKKLKNITKTESTLSISEFEEDGEIVEYYVDPKSGSKVFKAIPDVEVMMINGVNTIIYNDVATVNEILNDPNFKHGVFMYNFEYGDLGKIKEYFETFEPKDKILKEVFSKKTKGGIKNAYYKSLDYIARREASRLNKSWKKQLELIAARIPAQSLQSFMMMEIVGFVDEDINAVVLPVGKNWLDGSDFDIDKTYMLGFSVDKRGLIYNLNNFFEYDLMESAFLGMSIPTGKSYNEVQSTVLNSEITPEILQKAALYILGRNEWKDPVKEEYEAFLKVVSSVTEDGEFRIIPDSNLSESDKKNLIKAINEYNKYVPREEVMLESTKNSVAQALMTISGSIGNLMSSERPISMDQTRDASVKTTKAQDSREISREDPMGIYMQIIQQNAGKAVVGISAVGEKIFFAYSYYINEKIRILEAELETMKNTGKSTEEIKNHTLATLRKLSGNTVITRKDGSKVKPSLIANVNLTTTPIVGEYYNEFLQNLILEFPNVEVIDAANIDDASLTISEVLSAATDNAKELILDKINAGPELAGVYMYMIMQGMEFEDISDIMISNTINKVVERSKANWFTPTQSRNNIDSAINYYANGVNQVDYFPYGVGSSLNRVVKNFIKERKLGLGVDEFFKLASTEDLKDFKKFFIETSGSLRESSRMSAEDAELEVMNETEAPSIGYVKSYKFSVVKYLNETIKRSKDMGVKAVFLQELQQFTELKEAADELTIFGGRLGINQGIPTKEYDSYNFDFKLNNFLFKQFSKFMYQEESVKKDISNRLIATGILQESDVNSDFNISTNGLKKISNIKKIYKMSPEQQLVIGDMYNLVKFSLNILDAELNLGHFKSMIDASYTVQDFLKDRSLRYDLTQQIMESVSDKLPINKDKFNHKFDEDEIKKISDYLVSKTITEFFNNVNYSFTIPKGSTYIENNGTEYVYVEATEDKKLNLSTPEGKASFKIYFETTVIPSLQHDSNFSKNKFVSLLTNDVKRNSITGSQFNYVKLNFNMSSITEGDKKNPNTTAEMIFNQIKIGFEELGTSSINGNRIWDMFSLYNIMINKNSFGSNTFTKLFQSTTYKNEENTPFYKFMEFTGLQDLAKDIYNNEELENQVLLRISPMLERDPKTFTKYYKKRENGKTVIYEVLEMKEKSVSSVPVKFENANNELYTYLLDDFLDSSSTMIKEQIRVSNETIDPIIKLIKDKITKGHIIEITDC